MWLSYIYLLFTFIHPNSLITTMQPRIVPTMVDNNFIKKINNSEPSNIVLLSNKNTNKLVKKWLHQITESDFEYPNFIYNELVNTITYTIINHTKYTLYVGYKENTDDEPIYISCLNLNPEKRILSVELICDSPFITESKITEFKKALNTVSQNSGVFLNIKPLRYLENQRHYLDFTLFN